MQPASLPALVDYGCDAELLAGHLVNRRRPSTCRVATLGSSSLTLHELFDAEQPPAEAAARVEKCEIVLT